MKTYSNDFAEFSYNKGVLDVTFIQDSVIDLLRADLFVAKCVEITEHKPYACISIAEEGVEFTREARSFLAKARSNIYASALIADSTTLRVTANIFLKFNRPFYPTRFFATYGDALNWVNDVKRDSFSV